MTQEKLFNIEVSRPIVNNNTCSGCEHRQRWQCNSRVFQYCGIRKSNRTDNGLLKVKCKNEACGLFINGNQ